jgi:REP element-mobilizing transposase RayT
MPRHLRIEYPGAIYHVINRGDRQEDIFRDDEDRHRFISTLGETCQKTRWQVHAWCLMRNHFHLVIETPEANLVAGMKWLLGVYTIRFNLRHKWCGHLFAGRYKALLVDGASSGYLRTVCDYVHLNPARARILPAGASLENFVWSSYGQYLKTPSKRLPWLRVDRLLGECGITRDTAAGRREFSRQIELRCEQEQSADYREIRRGWCFGDEQFRKELLISGAELIGTNHYGSHRNETSEERAQRIVIEELKNLKWDEEDLAKRRKGDNGKVRIARRLRQETTMSLVWIATRLKMGTWSNVSNLLRTGRSAKSED